MSNMDRLLPHGSLFVVRGREGAGCGGRRLCRLRLSIRSNQLAVKLRMQASLCQAKTVITDLNQFSLRRRLSLSLLKFRGQQHHQAPGAQAYGGEAEETAAASGRIAPHLYHNEGSAFANMTALQGQRGCTLVCG